MKRLCLTLLLILTFAAPVMAQPVDTTPPAATAATDARISATVAGAEAALAEESAQQAEAAAQRARSVSTDTLEGTAAVVEEQGEVVQDLATTLEEQLSAGQSLGTVFRSPAVQASLFILLASVAGGIATYLGVNGFKLSTELRGKRTQLTALLMSTLTAAVPGYFGVSSVPGIDGWEGVALAAIPGVLALLQAVGIHETREFNRTGMRKPERQRARAAGLPVNRLFSPQVDAALESVVEVGATAALSHVLPPQTAALIADTFGDTILDIAEKELQEPLNRDERLELLDARKAALKAGFADQVQRRPAPPASSAPSETDKVKLTRPDTAPGVTTVPAEGA